MLRKALTAAFLMALLLALGASSAAARNALTATPEHVVVLFPELTLSGGGQEIICEVVLDASFHPSIPKSLGTLAGLANVQVFEETCIGNGTAGLLEAGGRRTRQLVQYHITFEGFEGTLPNITAVTLLLAPHFWIEAAGGLAKCLSEQNIRGTTTGGNPATGLITNETVTGLRNIGGLFCPESAVLTGTASFFREKEYVNPVSVRIGLI